MAKERMVTRTIEVTTYSVMTLNIETAEPRVIDYKITGTVNADPLKHLKKLYETDTLKLVTITGEAHETALYGMTEQDFIRLAEVLPPRAAV